VKKGIIFTILLAVLAFTTIGMWGDLSRARGALAGFPWLLLPVIMFFGFMNDFIKFLRWDIYLKKMGLTITPGRSLHIFLTGLSMSATPGKVGFLLKSQLLKTATGYGLIATSPVVVAELFMDLIGLCVITLLGLGMLGNAPWVLALCALPLLGLVPAVSEGIIGLLSKIPFLEHRADELKQALDDMFRLFGPRVLMVSLVITLFAWTSEGVALNLILSGLGYDMGVMKATVIFGFSTLVGVLSFLPGGLVVTDASLMGLLIESGIPAPSAAVASIMARLCTLWLSVCIGSLFLIINRNALTVSPEEAITHE
jgi:glycosyltransferase 2 family protein